MALWGGNPNLDLRRRLGKLPLKITYAALKSSAVNAIFGSVNIQSPRFVITIAEIIIQITRRRSAVRPNRDAQNGSTTVLRSYRKGLHHATSIEFHAEISSPSRHRSGGVLAGQDERNAGRTGPEDVG
jgi:hypothetical protein